METLIITKAQLEEAIRVWTELARSGGTRTAVETGALAVDLVAAESADYLWGLLSVEAGGWSFGAGKARCTSMHQ